MIFIDFPGSSASGKVGNPIKDTFGQPINQKSFDLDLFIESDVLYKQYGGSKLYAAPELRKSLVTDYPNLFEGLKPGKEGLSIKFRPNGQVPTNSVIFN